jgi:hypothetical protein
MRLIRHATVTSRDIIELIRNTEMEQEWTGRQLGFCQVIRLITMVSGHLK